ncbi:MULTISPECIES: transglutaminase domain-containing protein [unclassified Olleya]|jgi:transglutaminase/protease-like cytokinesis protein 3|uniref:transglutaminase domain-containing protein n=1 Tax=unclassified Olleya TaxID=2615019 RepID=UPI0011A928F3|nr:transglutaminase domain-containing protein [Olleya sp. Hel_I_94]TVZ49777.1 transglutaminase superfamily protein [Olleya sp. Hel_I_94]
MKKLSLLFCFLLCTIVTAQITDFDDINFTRADNIAKRHNNLDLKNLPLLAHNLTFNLPTEAEKFRAIYTWVCSNIKGDLAQDSKVSKNRKKFQKDSLGYVNWNNSYKNKAIKKLLKQNKTMCTGYAYLIKELCFLANIECKIINGYGRSTTTNVDTLQLVNHSWNAVKLNDKWYLCDATWSSGYFINDVFIKDYNLGYFLTEPILFAKNHYPINKKWLLDSTLIASDYQAYPMVYGKTFTHQIIPIYPSNLNTTIKRNDVINFSFKMPDVINIKDVTLIEYSGFNEITRDLEYTKQDNGQITLASTFKNEGIFDVHLKFKNDIISSYTIQVLEK